MSEAMPFFIILVGIFGIGAAIYWLFKPEKKVEDEPLPPDEPPKLTPCQWCEEKRKRDERNAKLRREHEERKLLKQQNEFDKHY